jgi:hypothetical protein
MHSNALTPHACASPIPCSHASTPRRHARDAPRIRTWKLKRDPPGLGASNSSDAASDASSRSPPRPAALCPCPDSFGAGLVLKLLAPTGSDDESGEAGGYDGQAAMLTANIPTAGRGRTGFWAHGAGASEDEDEDDDEDEYSDDEEEEAAAQRQEPAAAAGGAHRARPAVALPNLTAALAEQAAKDAAGQQAQRRAGSVALHVAVIELRTLAGMEVRGCGR